MKVRQENYSFHLTVADKIFRKGMSIRNIISSKSEDREKFLAYTINIILNENIKIV